MKILPVSFLVPKISKSGANINLSPTFLGGSDASKLKEDEIPLQSSHAYTGIIEGRQGKGRVEVEQRKDRNENLIETHTKYRRWDIKEREAIYKVDGDRKYMVSMVHYDEAGTAIKALRPSGNGGAVILDYNIDTGNWDSRELSTIHYERLSYTPKLAGVLQKGIKNVTAQYVNGPTKAAKDSEEIERLLPKTYGQPVVQIVPDYPPAILSKIAPLKGKNVAVILSGGQAPGGHNVISGLYDALKEANYDNQLYGFKYGAQGLIDGDKIKITDDVIDEYRNTGGFDMIHSSRKKLDVDKEEELQKILKNCKKLDIDTIVVVGGDDSNTNAGLLAEWMKANNTGIQVLGCPKTIDGDLQNEHIEIPFGFDTATKTYAETIGNIQRDAKSAGKYTHFIKLMGRSASHVVLEVALRAHPNVALISEEIEAKNMSLDDVANSIVDVVVGRAEGKGDKGEKKNYSVILVPEGLLEFIPEVKRMNASLSDILDIVKVDKTFDKKSNEERFKIVESHMNEQDAKVFNTFPDTIKSQLLLPKDDHGNTQVGKIETEKLLIELVEKKLEKLKEEGKYSGSFAPQAHYIGYEGRSAFPSNFDSDYCYSLGYNAFALAQAGLTGYMSSIKNLTEQANSWQAGGVPLTSMMNMEKRNGKPVPVIQKAMVDLEGSAYQMYQAERSSWAFKDNYKYPSGVQYFGPDSVCNRPSLTQIYRNIPPTDCELLFPEDILKSCTRSFQTNDILNRRVIKTVTPEGREFVTKTHVNKEDKNRVKTTTYEVVNGELKEKSWAKYDNSGKTIVYAQVEKEGGFHYLDFPKGEWVISDEKNNTYEKREAQEYLDELNSGRVDTFGASDFKPLS